MSIQKVPKNVSKIMGTCLILKPIMVAPTFELKESIYNTFYQGLYKLKVEKNFSKGKLINGANKAIISSAQCIKDQKWDDFSNIAKSNVIKDLVEAMNKKSDEDKESLEKLLNAASFEENISKTFIISTNFSVQNLIDMDEKSETDFHTTFVSYIRNSENPKNQYFCNINISRRVVPLGKWKITGVNFFDNNFVKHFI